MRLGEMLLERQFVSADDLQRALELQKERGEKIGKILIDGGYCAARDVMAVLAEQLRVRHLFGILGALVRRQRAGKRDTRPGVHDVVAPVRGGAGPDRRLRSYHPGFCGSSAACHWRCTIRA